MTEQTTNIVIEERTMAADEELMSIYSMDPSEPGYADMMQELRMLKRSDPELYRRIVNLD